MTYTIAEVARRCGLTAHTLRYYDKEGLLPFVDRNNNGVRVFKDSDFEWLATINCLKGSGVPVKKIKEFIDWCIEGDSTIEKRLGFLENHKKDVEKQMKILKEHMKLINYKIYYYKEFAEAGTTEICKKA